MSTRVVGISRFWAAAALGLAALDAPAAYVYVDTFTSPTQTVEVAFGGPASTFQYTNSTVAVGGEREVLLARTNTSTDLTSFIASSLSNGITYSSPASAYGFARLTYDGIDGTNGADSINFGGLASLDLTDGGNNDRFHVRGGADVAGGQFIITVYSSETDYSVQALAVPGTGTDPANFTNFFFTFAGMTDFGNGADFANVNAIVLELNGLSQAGVDLGVNLFVAIPEPTGWWIASALGALVLLRRRLARKFQT